MTENTDASEAPKKGIISVKSVKTDREIEFEKTFGENLEEAVGLYGAEVVFSTFSQQAVIKCQGRVRLMLDKGASVEDATKAGQEYIPGAVTRTSIKKDPVALLAAKVKSGEIDKDELLAQLTAALDG